jgi:hypothetical protein
MKAVVSDLDTLRSLKPLELAQYLRSKGWRQDGDLGVKATLWVRANETDEIILPKRYDFADFDLRISEVLKIFEKTEARSQLDILRDVQTTSADLLRLRSSSRDAADGSLAIDDAVSLVESSRDLMMAAACAAIDRRPYYATRKAQQVTEYLEKVRIGQTERGSFVLTILSPVPPSLKSEPGALFPLELPEPYERVVTRTLARSLVAVSTAAETAAAQGNMKPFEDAVQWGVSANLCEAIVRIAAVSGDSESEYAKAIQAHDRRSLVACTGELTRVGRTYRLENPRQFRVMEDT